MCQVNDGYNEKPEGRDNSLKRMSDKEEGDGGGKDCLKSPGFWSKVGRRLNSRFIFKKKHHLVQIVFLDVCLPGKIEEDSIP